MRARPSSSVEATSAWTTATSIMAKVYGNLSIVSTQILMLSLLLSQSTQAGQATVVQGSTPNPFKLAEGAPRPGAHVTEFKWLTGSWVGEGLGGQVEEVWSEPVGGSMVGHFRLVRDGKPVFYELLMLIEVEGSVEMRIKHMNPDMSGPAPIPGKGFSP